MAAYNNVTVVTPRELDDEDFDAEYFSRTYKPLSNLPTPPPSSRNSATSSPVIGLDDDADDVDSTLLGMFGHCNPYSSFAFSYPSPPPMYL